MHAGRGKGCYTESDLGLISRHHRPVYWSPSSRTALAEAELEYDDNRKCTAAFVKMPFVRLPEVLRTSPAVAAGNISALIWTTTPWTLPANKAIAVHDEIEYSLIELSSSDSSAGAAEQLLVAKERIEHVLSHLPEDTTASIVIDSIPGLQLADGKAACFNLFQGAESPILSADFVTATSGTGLVHMAPGHGMEDYQVCQKQGVGPAFAPVDDEGRYTAVIFPADHAAAAELVGLDVQTDGAKAVLKLLEEPSRHLPAGMRQSESSLVLAAHDFVHKNPIDWRTKQPVIVRATAQWFADVSAIQQRARASLDEVAFIPESGKTRLSSFLSGRSQWCISRQRAWGVPIPALYHRDTGEACISDDSIAHIISVLGDRGTDAWFEDAPDDAAWLHSSLEPAKWVRGKDTMDVWFDSGTTWTTLEPGDDGGAVSDVYIEGTDQHRGWFQSSLLTHVAVQDSQAQPKAPYGKLITHGFTLDAEGRKMSKSIGNVIAPDQIIDGSLLPPIRAKKQKGSKSQAHKTSSGDIERPKYDSMGPDALRLWVASSDYTRDVTIAVPLLQDVQTALQKYRVTFKWLLGVLADYRPESAQSLRGDVGDMSCADKAILHRLSKTSAAVHAAYGDYQFHKAVKEINSFVNLDLSAFYFEVCKDTLYTGFATERARAQIVLYQIMQELMMMLGPAVPHLVEEVWEYTPSTLKDGQDPPSHRVWTPPSASGQTNAEQVEGAFEGFNKLSAAVKLAQEAARRAGKVKNGLACKVHIILPTTTEIALPRHVLEWRRRGELADLLVVSQAEVLTHEQQISKPAWRYEQVVEPHSADTTTTCRVQVVPPDGEKCIRCWKFTAEEKDAPCQRCQDVLREKRKAA